MTETIRMFLLVGGVQIIGAVIDENTEFYSLQETFQIRFKRTPGAAPGTVETKVEWTDFFIGTKGAWRLYRSQVVGKALEIHPNIENIYRKRTSRLVLPESAT